MHIIDEYGTIITTTVAKPLNGQPDIIGLNIQSILKDNEYTGYMHKIKKTINIGMMQLHHYTIFQQEFIVVIQKKDDHSVIVHEARVENKAMERTKRILLASSGWLFDSHYKKDIGLKTS